MIIAHFITFLRQNFRTGTSGTFARSLSTYMHIHMQAAYGDAYCAKTQTYAYIHTCIHVAGTFPTGALVSTWIALGIQNIRRTSYTLITREFQQSARRFEGAYTINFVVRGVTPTSWKRPRCIWDAPNECIAFLNVATMHPTDSRVFRVFDLLRTIARTTCRASLPIEIYVVIF